LISYAFSWAYYVETYSKPIVKVRVTRLSDSFGRLYTITFSSVLERHNPYSTRRQTSIHEYPWPPKRSHSRLSDGQTRWWNHVSSGTARKRSTNWLIRASNEKNKVHVSTGPSPFVPELGSSGKRVARWIVQLHRCVVLPFVRKTRRIPIELLGSPRHDFEFPHWTLTDFIFNRKEKERKRIVSDFGPGSFTCFDRGSELRFVSVPVSELISRSDTRPSRKKTDCVLTESTRTLKRPHQLHSSSSVIGIAQLVSSFPTRRWKRLSNDKIRPIRNQRGLENIDTTLHVTKTWLFLIRDWTAWK